MMEPFDVLVVGGGAAGCVIARQISQAHPDRSVLLLEAGRANSEARFNKTDIASLFQIWFTESDWQLATTHQSGLEDRRIVINQGKVLGGGTSVNALMYVRGHHQNFLEWQAAAGGDPNWSPERLQASFRSLEGCLGDWADPVIRGDGGPLKISQPRHPSSASSAFLQACKELGYEQGDFNGAAQTDVCDFMQLIVDAAGVRSSTANAFLGEDTPPNLTVRCDTVVERLLMRDGVCEGVLTSEGTTCRGGRVILTAGALQTPALLMASGIGDPATLESVGVATTVSNPRVGRNLRDHMRVMVAYASRVDPGVTELLCEAALFTRSGLSETPETDLQINFSAGVDGFIPEQFLAEEEEPPAHTVIFVPVLTRPYSVGSIDPVLEGGRLTFSINPNYLGDERDLATYLRGVDLCRSLARTEAMNGFSISEICPGDAMDDVHYLRSFATTIWHPVGTCAVGTSVAEGVCDPGFRVWGTENLYVADASILPTLPSGNPQAAIFALANIASEVILT